MPGRLHDKRCLIVGGTSGLGLAAARRFLEEGAQVVIAGRSAAKGAAALTALANPPVVHFHAADAADANEVRALFEKAVAVLGRLDVLYHVAGISGRRQGDGPLHECSDEGWQTTIDANLKSVFYSNRAAVQQFLHQGNGGAILNMASVLALSPVPKYFDTIAYIASKGGIVSLSRAAAASYAVHGIRVNVITPGLIDTPMASRAVNDPAIHGFLRTKQPLKGGPGSPEDCADAAVFLCSDEARFITGAVLPTDGGWCVSQGQY